MAKITAIIIAKDEEKKITGAIKSVSWCDEVLVVDTGSTDKTKEVAKKSGARVITYTPGVSDYSAWRNKGAKVARGEWLFYIDADERCTPELKKEIIATINGPQFVAYAIPRKNIVLGKELTHGGFGTFDYVKRLFKKESLKKWTGRLHEEPQFAGRLGKLKNKLLHLKAQTLEEMVEKTNEWSEIEAKLMLEANHPPMNIPRFCSAMTREFWFRFVVHKAFLDGPIGIIHGLYQVFSRFVSYAKLWELQNARSNI